MSKRQIKAGATDQTIDIFIPDSTSTAGAGLSGLVYNSSGLKVYYRKGATGAATALTLATQTVAGAHSDGGFVEIDATNMKGVYRLDLSDTIVATAGMVTLYIYGATNAAPVIAELEVFTWDVNSIGDKVYASWAVDASSSPYLLKWYKQGTGDLGAGTLILTQTLKDIDGNSLGSVATIVARANG